jgi:hypothetical protein
MRNSEKRLLVIVLLLACIVPFVWSNSQLFHVWRVQKHIQRIGPAWEAFQRTNSGFEGVQFFAYTGGNGMLGAYGAIGTEEQVQRLRRFIDVTSPPRPVYLGALRVVGDDAPDTNKLSKP